MQTESYFEPRIRVLILKQLSRNNHKKLFWCSLSGNRFSTFSHLYLKTELLLLETEHFLAKKNISLGFLAKNNSKAWTWGWIWIGGVVRKLVIYALIDTLFKKWWLQQHKVGIFCQYSIVIDLNLIGWLIGWLIDRWLDWLIGRWLL